MIVEATLTRILEERFSDDDQRPGRLQRLALVPRYTGVFCLPDG